MSKHTPGPWEFDGEYVWADAIEGYVVYPNTEDMQSGQVVPLRAAHKQIKANGILMAAAPELLQALTDLLAMCERQEDFNDDGDGGMLQRAYAAIAKATVEPA